VPKNIEDLADFLLNSFVAGEYNGVVRKIFKIGCTKILIHLVILQYRSRCSIAEYENK
jgi:hypothetical protein